MFFGQDPLWTSSRYTAMTPSKADDCPYSLLPLCHPEQKGQAMAR